MFEFLKKRTFRLLPIYVVWSVVYLSLSLISNFGMGGDTEKFKSAWLWLSVVFNGGSSCHLWFLSSLLYVSIVMGVVAWYCHGWLLRIFLLLTSVLSIILSA